MHSRASSWSMLPPYYVPLGNSSISMPVSVDLSIHRNSFHRLGLPSQYPDRLDQSSSNSSFESVLLEELEDFDDIFGRPSSSESWQTDSTNIKQQWFWKCSSRTELEILWWYFRVGHHLNRINRFLPVTPFGKVETNLDDNLLIIKSERLYPEISTTLIQKNGAYNCTSSIE